MDIWCCVFPPTNSVLSKSDIYEQGLCQASPVISEATEKQLVALSGECMKICLIITKTDTSINDLNILL